jgi:hypothetical protein
MPMKDFVDVRVLLNGQLAREYANGEDQDTGLNTTRYIKVAAGQYWSVQVNVLRNFNIRWAPVLCVSVQFDDQDDCVVCSVPTDCLEHTKGLVINSFELLHHNSTTMWDDQHGRWAEFSNQIGALGSSTNTLPMSTQADFSPRRARGHASWYDSGARQQVGVHPGDLLSS